MDTSLSAEKMVGDYVTTNELLLGISKRCVVDVLLVDIPYEALN